MDKIIESTIKKLETVAIDPYPTLNPTLGIIYDEQGHICGDVDYDSIKDLADYITPVPNGVGAVTNTVLFAKLYANKLDFTGIDA